MTPKNPTSRSLWLGVATVFGLMLIAWSVLFFVAGKANVESVPLAPRVSS